jgi:hypothetical protein
MTAMQAHRKHRSREERDAIADETLESLSRLPISEDHPAAQQLVAAIERFRSMDRGRVHGSAQIPELGCALEYDLPTRRLLRQWVRCSPVR